MVAEHGSFSLEKWEKKIKERGSGDGNVLSLVERSLSIKDGEDKWRIG